MSLFDRDGKEVIFADGIFTEEEKSAILEYIDLMGLTKSGKEVADLARSKTTKVYITKGPTYGYLGLHIPGKSSGNDKGSEIRFDLSRFNTQTIAHELWHFLQYITKPDSYMKYNKEDKFLPHDEQRNEKGGEAFEGANPMGKQIDKEVDNLFKDSKNSRYTREQKNAKENIDNVIININNKNAR